MLRKYSKIHKGNYRSYSLKETKKEDNPAIPIYFLYLFLWGGVGGDGGDQTQDLEHTTTKLLHPQALLNFSWKMLKFYLQLFKILVLFLPWAAKTNLKNHQVTRLTF
jgi:hypothetical protein